MADNAHEITANATLLRDAAVNTPISERRAAFVCLAADLRNVGFKRHKCPCDEASSEARTQAAAAASFCVLAVQVEDFASN